MPASDNGDGLPFIDMTILDRSGAAPLLPPGPGIGFLLAESVGEAAVVGRAGNAEMAGNDAAVGRPIPWAQVAGLARGFEAAAGRRSVLAGFGSTQLDAGPGTGIAGSVATALFDGSDRGLAGPFPVLWG